MKGDFSRDTFNKKKHYSRVLHQQGRVQLDSDINEQTSIMLHNIRTSMADLIGPHGGPAEDENFGFEIVMSDQNKSTQSQTPQQQNVTSKSNENQCIKITPGRYYVNGILCENEKKDFSFNKQRYMKGEKPFDLENPPEVKACYLFYLQVWERYITYREDDAIREKALLGPDTAGRAQVVWQVKQIKIDVENDGKKQNLPDCCEPCDDYYAPMCGREGRECKKRYFRKLGLEKFEEKFKNTQNPVGLSASLSSGNNDTEAKYFGPENQLYRVEIHDAGTFGKATFKWSRDNGSHVTCVDPRGNKEKVNWKAKKTKADTIELKVLDASGFAGDNWVELSDDLSELRRDSCLLGKLQNVDSKTNTLSLVHTDALEKYLLDHRRLPIKVRLWDQIVSDKGGGAIGIKDDQPIRLEDGLEVKFKCPDGAEFRTGDYWIIPARAATGGIEWEKGKFAPPIGIRYSYAPLAVLDLTDKKNPELYDLRSKFVPFRGYIKDCNAINIKKLRNELRIWQAITGVLFVLTVFLAEYFSKIN